MDLHSRHILICDDCPDFFLNELKDLGFSAVYLPEIENKELYNLTDEFDTILIKSALILDKRFFEHFASLKLVFRPGSGLDNIDKEFCAEKGILIINSPKGNSNAVGEHTLGLLLSLTNNLPKAISEVRQLQWVREENRGIELENRGVAVIGVGNAGSAFCEKLKGFNCNLLPHDKYKPYISSIEAKSVELEQIFSEAEIVSLHLPLNAETRYYASEAFFNAFKKPIYFLNTSRGGVVDTRALLDAINTGRVVKAALDVIEKEPLMANSEKELEVLQALMDTGKVLITPHIAGWTHEAKHKMFAMLLQQYKLLP